MDALEHCELIITSIIREQKKDHNLANAIHEIFSTLRKHTYFKDDNQKKFIHHSVYYEVDITKLPKIHIANKVIHRVSHELKKHYKPI